MSSFSRREFLRRSGAAILGASKVKLSPAGDTSPGTNLPPDLNGPLTLGRAFRRETVHTDPSNSSPVVGHLTPDGIYPITQASGDWYQTSSGYVPRETMQPIQPYYRPPIIKEGEFWAELIAPSSSIREWCAGHAPILARLGFGAVVYVIDRLTDDHGQTWYGLTDQPGSSLIGWASGPHFAPLDLAAASGAVRRRSIHIDVRQQRLIVYDEDQPVGGSPIRASISESMGEGYARAIQPGGRLHADNPLGVPWMMEVSTSGGVYPVHGAFWHNRFGKTHADMLNMGHIELPTAAARWLYLWMTGYRKPARVFAAP